MSTPNLALLGQGYRPYLLKNLEMVVGTENAPQTKIDNLGTLNYVMQNKRADILTLSDGLGGQNTAQIKYLQRLIPAYTYTTDNCNNATTTNWREATVPLNLFREIALYFDEERFSRYQADVFTTMNEGKPPTSLMKEMIDEITVACNSIMTGINLDLITQLNTNVGVNRAYGNNISQAINFTQNTTLLPLNDGITKILADFQTNLQYGAPHIIGSGFWLNFFTQQTAKSFALNGLDTSIQAAGCKFYYDQQAQTTLGNNQAIVCGPNIAQLVEYFKFEGYKSGLRGTSEFGTIVLPFQTTNPNKVEMVKFDMQLKYNDCPTTYTDEYYGTTQTVGRGWQVFISKTYGLFQVPTDAYSAADPMYLNNGTYAYNATNN